ncbi:MAG: MarR family transcriptional regulator [Proteobacteria bacterium]|nr:MarR family transcriptional regulator [Pseudomonadota bacterium]
MVEYQSEKLKDLLKAMVRCCGERMAQEAKRLGLPHSEMECLELFDGERYLTTKGIAQRLGVAKSRVTRIVDGLVAKKLVLRSDDPNDARVKLIALTPAGRKKAEEIESILHENHRRVLLQLPSGERNRVMTAMETLWTAMETVKADLDQDEDRSLETG